MINESENTNSAKQQIINRLFNILQGQGMYVREDVTLDKREMLEQADVLLNLMKFLKDYDENIELLDKYWREKHRIEKLKQSEAEIDR